MINLNGIFSQIDAETLNKQLKEQESFDNRDFSINPGLYNATLERIRYEKARESNAIAAVFDYKLENGARFSERKWITNRNGNTMYQTKDEKTGVIVKKYLPGYLQTISLAKLHGLKKEDLEDTMDVVANIYGQQQQIVMVNPDKIKEPKVKLILRKEEYVNNNTGEVKQKDVIFKAFPFDTPDNDEKLQKSIKFVSENPVKKLKEEVLNKAIERAEANKIF